MNHPALLAVVLRPRHVVLMTLIPILNCQIHQSEIKIFSQKMIIKMKWQIRALLCEKSLEKLVLISKGAFHFVQNSPHVVLKKLRSIGIVATKRAERKKEACQKFPWQASKL